MKSIFMCSFDLFPENVVFLKDIEFATMMTVAGTSKCIRSIEKSFTMSISYDVIRHWQRQNREILRNNPSNRKREWSSCLFCCWTDQLTLNKHRRFEMVDNRDRSYRETRLSLFSILNIHNRRDMWENVRMDIHRE